MLLKKCAAASTTHSVLVLRRTFLPAVRLASSFADSKEYDLVVIGGGSGGLACSKEAAGFGKNVAVLDHVESSPQGTSWGLGGTCVNVGCIPKKLMHQASIVRHSVADASVYGWSVDGSGKLDWSTLTGNIQGYVKSLNWGHRVQLMDKNVEYINARGTMLDPNTVLAVDKGNNQTLLKSENIVIATGMRPKYMDQVPGMKENCITSDDLFWLKKPPGKTLVIGASYVALECAGFLTGLGFDTTVMMRSIPLRGFDQQMAGLVCDHMEHTGTHIIKGVSPTKVHRRDDNQLEVDWDGHSSESDTFNTILLAIGREAQTNNLGLGKNGILLDSKTGCILGGHNSDHEKSSIPNVYAIGDILQGQPELTPVAIRAGKLVARRMFGASQEQMDYDKVPTTVFTPLEYSCVGLSEEDAIQKYGADQIEVYHAHYKPLEYSLPSTEHAQCYTKTISKRTGDQQVLGIHLTGPNSGEIMQGFGVALRCGLTMKTLQSTIGIHPTIAEELVKAHITKRSGLDPAVTGC